VFDSTFKAFSEFLTVDSAGHYRPGKPLCVVTWWCIFDWFSIQTGSQTMGLYKMDHVTAKPVAARLRSVYQPFKSNSENAVLGIGEGAPALPAAFLLEQNYPNPFNGSSEIRFRVPLVSSGQAGGAAGIQGATGVTLQVFDLLGRNVATLVDGQKAPGEYTVRFDAGRLSSGTYVVRLQAGGQTRTRVIVLIR
jgi:hypothetical protein